MTTVMMTPIDAPAVAPTEASAGRPVDPRAAAQFGSLVRDALDTLEGQGGELTSTQGEHDDPDGSDDRDGTDAAATTAAAVAAPVPLPLMSPGAPPSDTVDAADALTSTDGAAANPAVTAMTSDQDELGGMPATGVDSIADPAAPFAGESVGTETTASTHHAPPPSAPAAERADVALTPVAAPPAEEVPAEAAGLSGATDAPVEEPTDRAEAKPSDLHSTQHADMESAAANEVDAVDTAVAPSPAEVSDAGEAWQQVARAVRSVHRDVDGNHTMTVRLDPPELGTVELEVQVRDGRLHVHATAESAATRDALARAMPELRAALAADGIASGSLDVGARTGGHGLTGHGSAGNDTANGDASTRNGRAGNGGRGGASTGPAATAPTFQPAADAPGAARLDLRL